MVLLATIRVLNIWENRRRDKAATETERMDNEFMDLTDGENKEFRYQM